MGELSRSVVHSVLQPLHSSSCGINLQTTPLLKQWASSLQVKQSWQGSVEAHNTDLCPVGAVLYCSLPYAPQGYLENLVEPCLVSTTGCQS